MYMYMYMLCSIAMTSPCDDQSCSSHEEPTCRCDECSIKQARGRRVAVGHTLDSHA